MISAPVSWPLNDGDGVAPLTLRLSTLKEAADEAGRSRLYGGIHFQDGDLRAGVSASRSASGR